MLEILTNSGAVIHIDEDNPRQLAMLEVASAAFGGIVLKTEMFTAESEEA